MPQIAMPLPLTLEELSAVAGGRPGVHDMACPFCGPGRRTPANRTRRVLRLWLVDARFATWCCARCGAKGQVHAEGGPSSRRPSPGRLSTMESSLAALVTTGPAVRRPTSAVARLKLARFLWKRRQPVTGSVVETYLREARNVRCPLPATLGYLPARDGHPPAMIAPFGLSTEPEPGLLAIDEEAVFGVHITRLEHDGSSKHADRPKIMIGRCLGSPIVLAPMNDGLGLAVTEGIEDALSIHEATGLGAWAAGAASRLPALAAAIPAYAGAVSVIADDDPAGRRFAAELAAALRARHVPAATLTLEAA
jgi:hypothetical protein